MSSTWSAAMACLSPIERENSSILESVMYCWTVFTSPRLHASLKGSGEGLGGALSTKGLAEFCAMDSSFSLTI